MATENIQTISQQTNLDKLLLLDSGKATRQQAEKIIHEFKDQNEQLVGLWRPIVARLDKQIVIVTDFLREHGQDLVLKKTTGDYDGTVESVNYRIITEVKGEESTISVDHRILRKDNGESAIINVTETADSYQNSLAIDSPDEQIMTVKCADGTSVEYIRTKRRYCVVMSTTCGFSRALFPDRLKRANPCFTTDVDPAAGDRAAEYFQNKILKALKNPTTRIEQ